jgi:hypothetical protein
MCSTLSVFVSLGRPWVIKPLTASVSPYVSRRNHRWSSLYEKQSATGAEAGFAIARKREVSSVVHPGSIGWLSSGIPTITSASLSSRNEMRANTLTFSSTVLATYPEAESASSIGACGFLPSTAPQISTPQQRLPALALSLLQSNSVEQLLPSAIEFRRANQLAA